MDITIPDIDIPKIDLPEVWLIGTDIQKELLSLYTNYPVRLKCEIFVLCMDGEVEASINLNKIKVKANDVITLTPGNIFQIDRIDGNLKIYFLGFSASYVEQKENSRILLDTMYQALGRPVLSLSASGAKLLEEYFNLLIHTYLHFEESSVLENIAPNIFTDVHTIVSMLYSKNTNEKVSMSKSEQICRSFTQLVLQHYSQNRNVAWYAEKLGITHAYLCTTVKQAIGKTCVDVISSMVIMDAKSQLKSTDLSIQQISDSLNFANMSFFGKYFKRHVGMSPLDYRNNG